MDAQSAKIIRQSAIVQAAAARALIEAMGMQATNQHRQHNGDAPAYDESHFLTVIDRNMIGHNGVILTLDA